jgi:ribosomal protein S18 acetylase RimI-like enzyme
MQIDYLDYLPDKFRPSATRLYFDALKDKLEPVLGGDGRAHRALADSLATDKCLVATCDEKLVGIMGIQTGDGGFVSPSLKTMMRLYGTVGGILRMSGLMILHHRTNRDELYVDGVAVAHEMRNKGIGTHMFELLERAASHNGTRAISLDVIDTNTKAKALYERLGFVAVKSQSLWPLNLILKFPFNSTSLMIKRID